MSSVLFLLQKDTSAAVVSHIYAAIDSAEALRFQEYEALLALQCSARRALVNRVYCKERRCAIAIARAYRGFVGRTSFLKVRLSCVQAHHLHTLNPKRITYTT